MCSVDEHTLPRVAGLNTPTTRISEPRHIWCRVPAYVSTRLGSTGALIYLEIRRCLRLRGGDIIDGIKWIF